jgi:nicotinate-nucleotide adenylyltransferase
MNRIAVLGGTFDPIHLGHLALADTLTQTFYFEKILFIPCKQNLLKTHSPATTQERIEMINLAISPFSAYQCDTREITRKTPSYTIETLESLRADYLDDSITFTMGIDSFNTLEQWHGFSHFLKYVHLFIFPRPGYILDLKPEIQDLIRQYQTHEIADLHTHKHGYIYLSDKPNNSISSTEIRLLLKNKSWDKLEQMLSVEVLDYIRVCEVY